MNEDIRSELGVFRTELLAALSTLQADMNAGFARVDGEIAGLQAGQESLRSGQESLRSGQASLRSGQESLRAGQESLQADMNAGFVRVDGEIAGLRSGQESLQADMNAGFARVDHYIELQQAQHLELRAEVQEVKAMILVLTERVDTVESRLTEIAQTVQRVDNEVRGLRDWATREFADVRRELQQLREAAVNYAALRRDMQALEARIDLLERRLP